MNSTTITTINNNNENNNSKKNKCIKGLFTTLNILIEVLFNIFS